MLGQVHPAWAGLPFAREGKEVCVDGVWGGKVRDRKVRLGKGNGDEGRDEGKERVGHRGQQGMKSVNEKEKSDMRGTKGEERGMNRCCLSFEQAVLLVRSFGAIGDGKTEG